MRRVISIVLFITVILSQSLLYAGLKVEPFILEIVAKKEGETRGVFKVLNDGSNPLHIRISPEKWHRDRDIGTWLTLEPMEFILNAGEEEEVVYKIICPEDATGELTCMVFFVADEMGEQRSNVGIRFGVPIYAVIGGTQSIEVQIAEPDVKYDSVNGILSGEVYIDNKSNVHIRPHIKGRILDTRDKEVTVFELPFGQPVQVGQKRIFNFEQGIVLTSGKYKLIVSIDYGRLWGFGDKVAEKKMAFIIR